MLISKLNNERKKRDGKIEDGFYLIELYYYVKDY